MSEIRYSLNSNSIDFYDGWETTTYYEVDERIISLIKQLQQENKKLKEKNELEFNDFIKFKKQQEDRYLKKTDKLIKENWHLKKQLKQKDEVIDEAIEKLQLLIDIGFDYDGYNQVDSLKTLIDELVNYARESKRILIKGKGDNNG